MDFVWADYDQLGPYEIPYIYVRPNVYMPKRSAKIRRSGHHVLIAVPTRGQVQWQTCTALAAAVEYTPALRPVLYEEGNLSVALTRNQIVKKFLEIPDVTTLIMVDDDIAPPVNLVEMLDPWIPKYALVALPHAATNPNRPGQLYLTAYSWVKGGIIPTDLNIGINHVDCVATGCVAISREALESLGPAPFRMATDPDDELRSDDLLFCRDLGKAGYKVGAFWDGREVDHFRLSNLAEIHELQIAP